jgi:hypothetical protein
MCSGFPRLGVLRRLRPIPDPSAVGAPSPSRPPAAEAQGRIRNGSRVHCGSLNEGGARLCPCGLAAGTPQPFPAASLAARAHRRGSSLPQHARQVRAASSPDPPDSSWRRIKGMSHAGSSRTPLRHACRTQTIWQYWPVPALSGLLPPSPTPLGSGCPQLHRPAATGSAAKVSHLLSNHSASRRTHDLRHTCASLLLAQNVPARVVMEILGHSQLAMTTDLYSHVMPTALRAAADAMDRVLVQPN